MTKTRIWRAFALGSATLLLAVAMSPAVAAQSQLNVRSVGEIFVDAHGRASGQNVETTIAETHGVLSGFVSLALGKEIFSSVTIDGFAQAEKIQGVGSSSLVLRGSNAVVALYDNINTAMKVQATSATTLHYKLAADVGARASESSASAVDLFRGGSRCMSTGPECGYLGSLVLVGGEGRGEALAVVGDEVQARAQSGTQVVFLAKPVYFQAEQFHHAVVHAAAQGSLAAHYVTEFEGSAVTASQVDYASTASARTVSTAQGGVETQVRSRVESSAVLAYDLAYESLPARSADDVAVYVDGQLAARAESAAQVQQNARAGVASYFAFVQNGRSEILASTPDFRAVSEHKVSIAANARASTESQARAENNAEAGSRAYGDFEYHGNGKLTGDFLTSILAEGQMKLHSYTALATRTEVFKSVAIEGDGKGELRSVDAHSFQVSGPQADLTLVDDVYATLLIDAKARAEATFELAADVKARQQSDDVVRLEGPNGYAGMLVIADANARADATADAASSLTTDAQGRVSAQLQQGARVVYRGAAESYASEDAVAEAIARGQIGAQVLAGVQGSAAAALATEYYAGVAADVTAKARGSFEVSYRSHVESAKSFAFDTRGTALAAKTAADVRVLVDGQAAVLVSSPEAVLAASGYAKYYAETSVDGSLRVLVNTAAAAGATAKVAIESKLDAAARAAANADAFGTFKLFNDGTAVGSFVTLKADQQAGAVSDFTLISTGQQLFTSVAAGASAFIRGGADGATTLALENKESKMEFSDTTSAFTKIVAKADTQVAFRLAANVNAAARADAVVELVGSTGAHVGSLIITKADGSAAASSRFQADAEGQVKAHLEKGAQILFRAHTGIETELSAAQRTMINQAIAGGQIAGQVLVQTQASLSASAHAAAQAQARAEAGASAGADAAARAGAVAIGAAEAAGSVTAAVTATYSSNVEMLTAATQNRVDVTISSTAELGKTIIVSLDPATIQGMASGNAEILFDGHVATQASSYSDILDANDDGGVAEYFVLAGEAGTQVLVSIPHFSVHTVTLKERDAGTTPLYMIATLVLGTVVLAETALLVRRRKA